MTFLKDFHLDLAPAMLTPTNVIDFFIGFLLGLGPLLTNFGFILIGLLFSCLVSEFVDAPPFISVHLWVVLDFCELCENPDLSCVKTSTILHVHIDSSYISHNLYTYQDVGSFCAS